MNIHSRTAPNASLCRLTPMAGGPALWFAGRWVVRERYHQIDTPADFAIGGGGVGVRQK